MTSWKKSSVTLEDTLPARHSKKFWQLKEVFGDASLYQMRSWNEKPNFQMRSWRELPADYWLTIYKDSIFHTCCKTWKPYVPKHIQESPYLCRRECWGCIFERHRRLLSGGHFLALVPVPVWASYLKFGSSLTRHFQIRSWNWDWS